MSNILEILKGFVFKLKPFKHQLAEFLEHGAAKIRAILWEQGTGKTKLIIDEFCALAKAGEVDALLIVAPQGVDDNWISEEIPIHMPDNFLKASRMHLYQNNKTSTQWHKQALDFVMRAPHLAIVACNYDTFRTNKGKLWLRKFLLKRKVFYVLDEHTDIKNPNSKAAKSIVASGRYAEYKRIMDGTPVTVGPFDVYAPIRFLDEHFWKQHDLDDFGAFKTHFGIYQQGYNKTQDRKFEQIVGYRRLDELQRIIAPISTRVLKDDVLDLPPKTYSKIFHEMTPKQARMYKEMKEYYMTMLDDETVVATLPIVQLLRLQQIVCGYVPTEESKGEDGEPARDIDDKNPRIAMATWYFDHMPHKCLVWARFIRDIDLIMHQLKGRAVRYDGTVSRDQRAENKHIFQTDEKCQFFVANPAAAGRGLTLIQARSELYYSNSFKLRDRLQSEDRAHRAGQQYPVNITDMMCKGTVDTRIVGNLRKKFDIASKITGDKIKEWI